MDAMRIWTPLSPGTALPLDRPSVFLESTAIAQGLPWPENLETALAMVAAVQESGAVPSMIAVLDGVVRIGLSAVEIEAVARSAETPETPEPTGQPRLTRLQRPPCCAGRRRAVRLKSRGPTKSRKRRARTHASERERSQAP